MDRRGPTRRRSPPTSPDAGRNPMRLHLAATAIIVAGLSGHAALAQDGVSPVYAITYLEVAPNSAAEARQLILTYSADARKAAGAVHIEALQRIGYASHFALIEQWQSQKSKDEYAAGAAIAGWRDRARGRAIVSRTAPFPRSGRGLRMRSLLASTRHADTASGWRNAGRRSDCGPLSWRSHDDEICSVAGAATEQISSSCDRQDRGPQS